MVWLIIGIIVLGFPVGMAALVRSLRLEGWKKLVLAIFSTLSMAALAVALIGTILPELDKTFVRIFFYSGLGVGLLTLAFSVHFLAKLHNKVFTDKTKEHHESVARILEEQKQEEEKLQK